LATLRNVPPIVIIAVNYLFSMVLQYFSKFDYHVSQQKETKIMFLKMFLLEYFNIAMVMVITTMYPHKIYNLEKQLEDLGGIWFAKIGYILTLTFIYYIAFIPLLLIYKVLRFNFWYYFDKMHIVQRENANAEPLISTKYYGETFEGAYIYSVVTVLVVCAITFNLGMPLLYPITWIFLWVVYWCFKYLFLRVYTPGNYKFDVNIPLMLPKILQLAVILHILLTLGMLSNDRLFPYSDRDQISVNKGFNYNSDEVAQY